MLKKIGSWIGSIKRYVSNLQQEVTSIDVEDINSDDVNSKEKENDQKR